MSFPVIEPQQRQEMLIPPTRRIAMVMDADPSNEIDDQYALVYSLLSPDRIRLEACYAAPYLTRKVKNESEGMHKSFEETNRVLDCMGVDHIPVHKGADTFLSDPDKPVESPAAADIIARSMAADQQPLYVVCTGAATNVASAILMRPEIIGKIVVVWLGGHPYTWHTAREFNLSEDIIASRLLFDCGVPLVHVPCKNVAEHLSLSLPEAEAYAKGRGAIGDYLYKILKDYWPDHLGWSKAIWDVATVAYLVNPEWVPTHLVHSPVLMDNETWSRNESRHLIRTAVEVNRNAVFRDFFKKLELQTLYEADPFSTSLKKNYQNI